MVKLPVSWFFNVVEYVWVTEPYLLFQIAIQLNLTGHLEAQTASSCFFMRTWNTVGESMLHTIGT